MAARFPGCLAAEDGGRRCARRAGSFGALAAVAATWITYFAALYLNFCDFSRYAKSEAELRKGNLWGLPVNLLAFCLVAGITTTAAYTVYGEDCCCIRIRYRPSSTAGSWRCLRHSPSPIATLGINVVANFVSPAFDFANVFPKRINFKRGG